MPRHAATHCNRPKDKVPLHWEPTPEAPTQLAPYEVQSKDVPRQSYRAKCAPRPIAVAPLPWHLHIAY